MRHKFIAPFVAISLLLSVTACGSSDDEATDGQAETKAPTGQQSATQSPKVETAFPVTKIDAETPLEDAEGGIFMAYAPSGNNGDCAVLNISSDGEVGVVSYFDATAKHQGSNISGPQGACLESGAFSQDYNQRAAVVGYSLGAGNDSRASVLDSTGAYTDLSGNDGSPTKGLLQSFPTFGPDGRLWYWSYQDGLNYDLWSVDTNAGPDSAKHESGFEDNELLRENLAFGFLGNVPISLQNMKDTLSDKDGEHVVQGNYGSLNVGSATELDKLEPYTVAGDTESITPMVFTDESSDGKAQFIGTMVVNGDNNPTFFTCAIDEASKTIMTTKLDTPTDLETAPDSSTNLMVLPDGTVYYTNNDQVKDADDNFVYATRVMKLNDGEGEILAIIENMDNTVPAPTFLDYR